jgi:hypothetical protein
MEEYPVYAKLSAQKLSQLDFDDCYLDEETCICPYFFAYPDREVCMITDPKAPRCDYCPDLNSDLS